MARIEPVVLTNMCMIYDDNGNILVQDRKNPDWPGITFPGGHIEPEESFVRSVIREVKEETGLDIAHPQLCGSKQFMSSDHSYRYVVLFYKCNHFSGTLRSSEEGEVFWIPRKDLCKYPLAPDFEEMIKIFESDELSEFYYYHDENKQWNMELL